MKKCLGCGMLLQSDNKNALGYIENMENNLCERCYKLKYYGQYMGVSLTNEDYMKILSGIPKNAVVLYVTDVLSLDCLGIEKFKNVILVITKKDILPKSTNALKIIHYVKKQYSFVRDVFFISSKTGEGISQLYDKISEYNELYVVGTTNSGKSSLINKMINFYDDSLHNDLVTVSMYPSTTLDKIEVRLNQLTLIDTPGLINKKSIVNYLDGSDIKKITPKKEIKPKSCQIEGSGSLIIDNILRIDYYSATRNSIVFYVSNNLTVRFASFKSDFLHDYEKDEILLEDGQDVVIPGLGFIKCVKKISMTIYKVSGTGLYIRDNLI